MPAEVGDHVKAFANAKKMLPGLVSGNQDNWLIAYDIKDDDEDLYEPELD